MIVPVSLGGHEVSWAFRGSRPFQRWLAAPAGCGEVRVAAIQTTGPRGQGFVDDAVYWLAQMNCLRDGRHRHVRVDSDESPDRTRALLGSTPSDTAQRAGGLSGQTLLVQTVIRSTVGRSNWAETVDWLEDSGKRTGLAIRAIATDVPAQRVSSTTQFDFRSGWPTAAVLEMEDAGKQHLWNAYLHARIAWEAGGNLDRAYSLSESRRLPGTGCDDELEKMLQLWAVSEFSRLPVDTKKRALDQLDCIGTADVRLLDDGTWWQPNGGREARPTSWCSRALLDGRKRGRFTELFRSAIVCQPLASEILHRCIDTERLVRGFAVLQGLRSVNPPSAEAERKYSQFVARRLQSTVYPAAHPARPETDLDAWLFAGLGEFLSATRLSPEPRRNAELLRDLRNALAHGHYVCWQHIEQARTLRGTVNW